MGLGKKSQTGRGEKIIAGSFWLIAVIHITVFTVIGAATSSWRLLIIFMIGFVLIMAGWACVKFWLSHPEKKAAIQKLPLLRNVCKK